jgi:hypothetical protein
VRGRQRQTHRKKEEEAEGAKKDMIRGNGKKSPEEKGGSHDKRKSKIVYRG